MVFLILYLIMSATYSSREGVLPFTSIHIFSEAIDESGPVVVKAKKDTKRLFSEITVRAFGKTIEIPQIILNEIPSAYHNGIQLSYEGGYEELGGRVIYLQFHVGVTSGIRDKIIIAIFENGDIEIFDHS